MRNNFSVPNFIVLFLVLSVIPAHAQTSEEYENSAGTQNHAANESLRDSPADFFIAPLAEIIGYSRKSLAFGSGFALGAGSGVAIGLHFLYTIDTESINTMEIIVFMRFYLQGAGSSTGLFVQLNTGASIIDYGKAAFPPAESGDISAGLAVGWRFLLKNRWYLEPVIRVGYPYIAGVGVSFAYRL